MLPGRAALVRPSPINSSALPHGDKLIIEEIPLDSPFNPGSNNVSRARIRSKESPPRSQSCLLHSGARVSSGEKDRRASPPSRGRGSLRHLAFHTRFRSTRALHGPRPRARASPSHGRTQAGKAIIDEHRPEEGLPEDDGCGLHSTTVGCFAWDHPTRKASQFPEPPCRCVPPSMRRGASPARTREGSTSKAARSWGSPESSATSEDACRRPVIVLPRTRKPSRRTPPE